MEFPDSNYSSENNIAKYVRNIHFQDLGHLSHKSFNFYTVSAPLSLICP